MLKNRNIIFLWMSILCTTLTDTQHTEAKFSAGKWFTFQATNSGLAAYYLSYKNELGFIVPFEDTNDQFRFQLVPGLADKNYYSIESKSYPGRYLRHQGYRIKLHLDDRSDLFKKDATWMVRQPTSGQVRFESYNFMGHFLRHFNYELWLGSGNGNDFHTARLFLEDSTYNIRWDENSGNCTKAEEEVVCEQCKTLGCCTNVEVDSIK